MHPLQTSDMLSGSRRELPIYALGFVVLALISEGYFDGVPSVIFGFLALVLLLYYFLNPDRGKARKRFPVSADKIR
jgi:uncharacterized membrane protein YfcA